MFRFKQALLILSTVLLSWLLMQDVHEAGHMAATWLSGGTVKSVLLDPFSISRTDVEPNPHPLIVVWGGPVVGALLPFLTWRTLATLRFPSGFLKFFAGFCLIANGAYIGFGSFQRVGDCGEMLRHGAPIWLLWLFGILAIVSGLWTWNGAGKYFGLGKNADPIATSSILLSIVGLLLVAMLGNLTLPAKNFRRDQEVIKSPNT
jgi:hypothetical protein